MTEAYKIASNKIAKRKGYDEQRWSQKLMLTESKPGDKVLVKNVLEKGRPGKLRSH